MRFIYLPLAIITFSLFISSCKKDSEPVTPGPAEYVKLDPGNYWLYQSFLVDSTGHGGPGSFNGSTIYYDSIYVEKDTVIGAYTYHKLMTPTDLGSKTYQSSYVRDSLKWEVGLGGQMILAPFDYATIFRTRTIDASTFSADSAVRQDIQMAHKNVAINTPAGVFETISMATSWTFFPYAAQRKSPYTRTQYTRYAAGVGMVSQTMPIYAANPNYAERRLLRYYVK